MRKWKWTKKDHPIWKQLLNGGTFRGENANDKDKGQKQEERGGMNKVHLVKCKNSQNLSSLLRSLVFHQLLYKSPENHI
jgi:hypothetical protein